MKTKIVYVLFLISSFKAIAQKPHLSDRLISGYTGNVKKVVKVSWRNAGDDLKNSNYSFDTVCKMAKEHIESHYTTFEKYIFTYVQTDKVSAKIVTEEFDASGISLYENDLIGTDMLNVRFNYTPAKNNRIRISGLCNKGGKKMWGGYLAWKAYNVRTQDMAMNDLFVMHFEITLSDSMPAHTVSQLKLKDFSITDGDTKLLSKANDKEVWLHVESSRYLKQGTESHVNDTVTHIILQRDTHGNILKEIIKHTSAKEHEELVFTKFDYYD